MPFKERVSEHEQKPAFLEPARLIRLVQHLSSAQFSFQSSLSTWGSEHWVN